MTHPCATCTHPEEVHTPEGPEDICQTCGDSFDPDHDWDGGYPVRTCGICWQMEETPEPDYVGEDE